MVSEVVALLRLLTHGATYPKPCTTAATSTAAASDNLPTNAGRVSLRLLWQQTLVEHLKDGVSLAPVLLQAFSAACIRFSQLHAEPQLGSSVLAWSDGPVRNWSQNKLKPLLSSAPPSVNLPQSRTSASSRGLVERTGSAASLPFSSSSRSTNSLAEAKTQIISRKLSPTTRSTAGGVFTSDSPAVVGGVPQEMKHSLLSSSSSSPLSVSQLLHGQRHLIEEYKAKEERDYRLLSSLKHQLGGAEQKKFQERGDGGGYPTSGNVASPHTSSHTSSQSPAAPGPGSTSSSNAILSFDDCSGLPVVPFSMFARCFGALSLLGGHRDPLAIGCRVDVQLHAPTTTTVMNSFLTTETLRELTALAEFQRQTSPSGGDASAVAGVCELPGLAGVIHEYDPLLPFTVVRFEAPVPGTNALLRIPRDQVSCLPEVAAPSFLQFGSMTSAHVLASLSMPLPASDNIYKVLFTQLQGALLSGCDAMLVSTCAGDDAVLVFTCAGDM